MTADALLSRLDGVKRTGDHRWRARCPSHGSRGGTLAIKEADDGKILMHCHAGCAPLDVLAAVGLGLDSLFPERDYSVAGQKPRPRDKRPWRASDVIKALCFEMHVAWAVLSDVANGKALSEQDRERASVARERIERFMSELSNAH